MSESLGLAIVAYGTVLAMLLGVVSVTGRSRPPVFTVGLVVLEVAAVLAAALDGLALLRGRQGAEVATNLGYLFTVVAVLPLTASMVRGDGGRWGNTAFAVGCLLLAVVTIRLSQTLGSADA